MRPPKATKLPCTETHHVGQCLYVVKIRPATPRAFQWAEKPQNCPF